MISVLSLSSMAVWDICWTVNVIPHSSGSSLDTNSIIFFVLQSPIDYQSFLDDVFAMKYIITWFC